MKAIMNYTDNNHLLLWLMSLKRHTVVSPMDPVELCSTLTSSTNKPSSMVNYGDQFGLTPLHVAARRGAGVCCLHLIKVGHWPNSIGLCRCQPIKGIQLFLC